MEKEKLVFKRLQELAAKKETNKALSDFYWYWWMKEVSPEIWLKEDTWSYYYNNTPMKILIPLIKSLT